MSRLLTFVNIFFIFIATTTSLGEHSSKPKPHTFVLPVLKDTHVGQYYTSLTVGEPPLSVNLTIDVRGRYLWFHCDKIGYNSTTYTPIHCMSPKCKLINGGCLKCTLPYGPSCRYDSCATYIARTVTFVHAPMVEDDIVLSYMSPSAYVAPKIEARLPFACAYSDYHMVGLRSGSSGVLGLGKTPSSFVNELVSTYKIPFKVALCLPSKPGINNSGHVYIGGGPYLMRPNSKDVSGLLVSTPLFRDIGKMDIIDVDDGYYIDVKSIQVDGKTLSLNKTLLVFNETSLMGGTKIETLKTYTYLETSIYKALLEAFARNAKKRKVVAPFTNCFSAKSFSEKKTPVITLVLGGGAKWNIDGSNSLVKVNNSVWCLGFIDGGFDPIVSIEIGGNLLEDHLVEFDLEASKFSFTPSLLLHNTSCSPM